jgi:hypothetical protein
MLRLVVATSLLVLVAGCTDPEPKEPKPTTSATPTATAPTMPAQAKENTPEGASAFVAHYIDVSNYAASTGDVEGLSRLSDSKCTGCQKYIKLYRDTYAVGGYFKGGAWTPGNLRLDFGKPETYVTTTVTSPESRFRTSSETAEETGAAESTLMTFGISRSGQEWQMTQLALGGAE